MYGNHYFIFTIYVQLYACCACMRTYVLVKAWPVLLCKNIALIKSGQKEWPDKRGPDTTLSKTIQWNLSYPDLYYPDTSIVRTAQFNNVACLLTIWN